MLDLALVGFYLALVLMSSSLCTTLPHSPFIVAPVLFVLPLFISNPLMRAYCFISAPLYGIRILELGWSTFELRQKQKSSMIKLMPRSMILPDSNIGAPSDALVPSSTAYHDNSMEFSESVRRIHLLENNHLLHLGIYPPRLLRRLLHPVAYFESQHICFCRIFKEPIKHNLMDEALFWLPQWISYTSVTVIGCKLLMEELSMFWWWVTCMVLAYTFLNTIEISMRMALLCLGMHADRLIRTQNYPFYSKSLREWWSFRWNYFIQQRVLKRWIFNVLVQKYGWGTSRAILATFIVSALWHALPIWTSVGSLHFRASSESEATKGWGVLMGWCMFLYFMCHYVLMGCETALKQRLWPTFLRRLWTAAAFILTSPLFFMPLHALFSHGTQLSTSRCE